MAGKVYTSSCPDNPPEWYWINGLHDACIVGVETTEVTFKIKFERAEVIRG